MSRFPLSALFRALLGCGVLGAAGPALAQAPAGGAAADEVQAVVVTAQKRSQSIKDVPVAISVVSGERLESQGIREVSDLSKVAPSLEFGDTKAGGAGGSASIRGIGTSVFTTSAESSVGIVVDGVPLGNTAGASLFDLERVEVLRGPQGTLFGKSASAGVLNISTRAPELKRFEGFASLELGGGEVGSAVARLSLNAPLGTASALRLTGSASQAKGVYHNTFTGRDSSNQAEGLRLRYLYRHSADLSFNLIADHTRTTEKHAVFFAPFAGNAASTTNFAACGVTLSQDNNRVCSDGPELIQAVVQGVSAQVDWSLGKQLTLTSITALRQRDVGPNALSVDMSNYFSKVRSSDARNDLQQFSQELRLASATGAALEWTAGLFFSDFEGRKSEVTTVTPNPAAPSPPVPREIRTASSTDTDIRSTAIFGQATFKLSPGLSVLAGLRHTRDTVSEAQTQNGSVRFATTSPPATAKSAAAEVSASDTSGKLGLLLTLDNRTRAYATVTRGYKAPQIDTSSPISALPASGSTSAKVIDAERPTTVELGLKGQFLQRRLDVDAAVFHSDIKGYQEQSCSVNATGGLTCVPINVPKVTSYGLEVDARARLSGGLSVTAAGSLVLGTKYPDGFMYGANHIGGSRLLYSPKGKLVLGAEYQGAAWTGWDWSVGGDVTYKTAVRYCNDPAPECTYKAHAVSSVRTTLRSADDKYQFTLFVRNLGDERVPGAVLTPLPGKGAGAGVAHALSASSFRSVGLSADMRF